MVAPRPQNYKELYNLRHASLRNAIERIFGVLKKRFPILASPPMYPYPTQVSLVIALFCLSNFINVEGEEDLYNTEWLQEDVREEGQGEDNINTAGHVTNEEKEAAKVLRDNIAKAMWNDYIKTCRDRGLIREM
jgi:hypothetical protein